MKKINRIKSGEGCPEKGSGWPSTRAEISTASDRGVLCSFRE
jgi:hypothetical protein